MPTIVLDKMDDFIRKCKELGVFNAYIKIESYAQKEGEPEKITLVARLTALTKAFDNTLLITNVTVLPDATETHKDPVMDFITEIQDKGDKIVFSYGVAMV